MIHLLNIEEWAERYKAGDLSTAELKSLHTALDEDKVLNTSFQQALQLQFLLSEKKSTQQLRNTLQEVATAHKASQDPATSIITSVKKPLMGMRRYWKPISAAATIALFSSLLTYTFTKDNSQKNHQYTQLQKDIATLKHSQNQIINNLNKPSSTPVVSYPGDYSGSGFAITNDGLVATNYHVVEGADSVFIQLNDGNYYKANIITANPQSDLAILKVINKDFTFGKALPYMISKSPSSLGQKIFTIGYPQDNIVYNEGYISSERGFNGDTTAYQLEITSNPGQSGAPILDNNGNVVGIITGKQTNTNGTTFAVHANELLSMINGLSKDQKINLNTKNRLNTSRPEQIKTLRDFVCAVRVYK
ncbi:serine protease [Taibaiella sp. KBW10]|uniref:S1C family serine protease n=1 Tax=Taibaiella sp. KBW10 TaxID=2153357 RepID=UPI000F5B51E4|nr:serine protease [Taibaiella sp. KBW10]RQO31776.1 serine protease [Taibaiella sp. KBW10]